MYERFFGLEDAPFRLTPDPRYLFLSRKHEDALAHLRLGLSESGFVCITGDVGTGKTTLLRHFLAGLGPDVSTAYIFNPALSALELLQTVNAEFGLPATGTSRKALTDALNAFLLAQRERGRRAVVVVDEAQALDVDVLEQLRLLSNLETPTEKLLRIILVGQPQLRTLLQHPELVQLNQRITLRWHIGPLAAPESVAYVRHRLSVASHGRAHALFTRRALARVHDLAGGVPRVINMIAHRALLAAFAAEHRRVGLRHVRTAYREISSVPLPATRRRSRLVPAAVGLAAGLVAIALGLRALAPPPPLPAVVAATPAAPPDAPAAARPAPEPTALLANMTLPAEPAAAAPEPAAAAPTPVAAPAPEKRLAAVDAATSLRAALGVVARAWGARPPDDETRESDLPRFAERRGLEHLPLSGNLAMLRLLDVPVVLELRLPDVADSRWATLVGLAPDHPVLAIDDTEVTVEPAFLERFWYGRAHVFARDYEGLGPGVLGDDARGARVVRLQALLARTGFYDGGETGVFGPSTRAAVTAFQRSRFVEPDGQVGRLTRMVLYAAVGGYARPTLAGGGLAGGAS